MRGIFANYVSISIICLLALSLLMYITAKNIFLPPKNRTPILLSILAVMVSIAAEIGTVCFALPDASLRVVHIISNVVGFAVSPLIPIFLSMAMYTRRAGNERLLLIPIAGNLVLTVLSPFFGLIFFVEPDNAYRRGGLFFMFLLAYVSGILLLFIQSLRMMTYYQSRTRFTLIFLLLFVLAGCVLQVVVPEIHTTWPCVSLSVMLYYAFFCELLETHDTVSGLLDRRAYEHDLRRLEARDHAVVIFFDVDDFKLTNDSHGHQYGDRCLRAAADAIKHCFGGLGYCYRIGGDEYAVLSSVNNESVIADTLQNFLHEMEQIRENDPDMPMVSFGYAFYTKSVCSVTQAVLDADRQLYYYKDRRKSHFPQ